MPVKNAKSRNVILQVLVSREERDRITAASDQARRNIGTASLSAYCREAILMRVSQEEATFRAAMEEKLKDIQIDAKEE